MTERREAPRRRVCLGGRILQGPLLPETACLVRDTSHDGARLRVGDAAPIAERFELAVDCRGRILRARVVWRSGTEIGVRFLGDAEEGRPAAPRGTVEARPADATLH